MQLTTPSDFATEALFGTEATMSRLDEAVRSVPADTSPADGPADDLSLEGLESDPVLDGKESNEDDQLDGEKGKRTIENVRGELLRKLQKSQQELMSELRLMREESLRMREQYGVPAPQTSSAQPKTLDDMTIHDLEAMRDGVPDDKRSAFDAYLQERKVSARVDERLNQYTTTTQRKQAEQRFNEVAVDRWPSLRDSGTEFYRVADRILGEMGTAAKDNPRAVLDAANEAGLELGMSPSTGIVRSSRQREPGKVVSGRASGPGPHSGDKVDMDELRKVADGLSNAMPGRKFTDEQLKRIAKRQKLYAETINSHVRG